MSETQEITGGQGDEALLADPHHERADLKTLSRAVREEWGVPPALRKKAVKRLETILDRDGEESDRSAVSAVAVLERMVKANQADLHHVEGKAAKSVVNNTFNGPAVIQVAGECWGKA